MDNIIGLVLKNIREQRGLSLVDMAGDIISPSYLSKVEHGTNQITFHNLLALLNKNNISLVEFMYQYDKHVDTYEVTMSHSLKTAHDSQNIKQLQLYKHQLLEKWNSTSNNNFYNQYLIAKTLLADFHEDNLTTDDIDYIHNYLFKIEHWSYYEYYFFSNTLSQLPPNVVLTLAKDLILKSNIDVAEKTKGLISTILLNIAITGIYQLDFELVHLVLEPAKQYTFNSNNYQHRVILMYIEALNEIHAGFVDTGSKKALKSVEMMRFIGEEPIANAYEAYYKIFLEKIL
ncbi:helix-turn-helix domain-containing protein [Periweissella cryptocerci]|nr:helix-turn-helix domain-containing protein [Periweissella cryptocerci]